jgi:hypothetical protein
MQLIFCHAPADPEPYYLQPLNIHAAPSVRKSLHEQSNVAMPTPTVGLSDSIDGNPVWTRSATAKDPTFEMTVQVANMLVKVGILGWYAARDVDRTTAACAAAWQKLWPPAARVIVDTLAHR